MTIQNLDESLKNAKTIGISGHIRPDGDCVGSCLGMWLFLKTYYPDIKAKVVLEPTPESFYFLEGADQISNEPDEKTVYDLFMVLDCSDQERLGANAVCFRNAARTLCIDHHITNGAFADENHVLPEVSSTCEILCDLIGIDRITRPMAEALYMGIAHDTGVFQYSNTSRHTMTIAGQLIDKGIDHNWILDETFYKKTYNQIQIMGRALLESIRMLDGRVIFSAIRKKDMDFFCVKPADLDGIVAQLRSIRGVDTAIFLYELGNQEWKVSLRSNSLVDVAKVASAFGGGGHVRAAGCTLQGSGYDVVNNIVRLVDQQLNRTTGTVPLDH